MHFHNSLTGLIITIYLYCAELDYI
uniref:Uncharacterized protein n=1 Tax=Anguilla anguilla TaxID=7936 RepID=A0A0E9PPX0_ANGAN